MRKKRRSKIREHPFSNRQRALRKAKQMIGLARAEHPDAFVHFIFRCGKCGIECTFTDRNMAPLFGHCHACGKTTKADKLAFRIFYKVEETDGIVYKNKQPLPAGDSRGIGSSDTISTDGDRES